MIHQDEEYAHQKWTDGVASPRKERQKTNDWALYRSSSGSKGKRGIESLSVTPEGDDDKGEARRYLGCYTVLVSIINLRV
jgi:hypothetical protein